MIEESVNFTQVIHHLIDSTVYSMGLFVLSLHASAEAHEVENE